LDAAIIAATPSSLPSILETSLEGSQSSSKKGAIGMLGLLFGVVTYVFGFGFRF
jgi:hypothetical protein